MKLEVRGMEERLFFQIMLPTVALTVMLLLLPDFALKIPLGLLIIIVGAFLAALSVWDLEQRKHAEQVKSQEE